MCCDCRVGTAAQLIMQRAVHAITMRKKKNKNKKKNRVNTLWLVGFGGAWIGFAG